jgi:hypothetical protein
MSGVVPKITIETENSSRPTVKIENPLNLDGIKITNADSDSDDSLGTVELEKVTKPITFKKHERPKVTKDNNPGFNSKDYQNFLNTSKTKKQPSTYSSSGSETGSYSDSYSGSESSSDSESSKSSSSVKPNEGANKKQQKRELLLKLVALEKRGIELTKKFSLSSKLSDLKFEYELHKNKAEIDVSVKFQQKVLVALVTGLEIANKTFDPIGAKLDGWSESVMDTLDDYESIFIKLHEKYKTRADLPPELQLLVTLVGSGFMFHMTKTFFNSAVNQKSSGENSEVLQKIMATMSNSQKVVKENNISSRPLSGPSTNYSNMLKDDDDTMSSGSVETSKEVTVNGKGKRAINL